MLLGSLQAGLGSLTGEGVWTGHAGRAPSELFDRWALAKRDRPALAQPAAFPATLAHPLGGVGVRPPYGGRPRPFYWGLPGGVGRGAGGGRMGKSGIDAGGC